MAGAVLATGEDAGSSARRRARLDQAEFPRYPRREEYERMQKRRTLPVVPTPPGSAASEPAPAAFATSEPTGRDPLLSAMGAGTDVAVVIEAGSFRRMPIGELFIACLGGEDGLRRIRDETGVDVDSVDRIAMTKSGEGTPTVMMTAALDPERIAKLAGSAERVAYGDRGTLFVRKDGASGGDHEVVAAWSDSLILAGGSRRELEAAIDRIEGRGALVVPAIPPEESYGEIYGHVRASFLSKLLPAEVSGAVRAAKDVELHVDATDDVLIVADVTGDAPAQMRDLARTLGGALSAARVTARAQGDDNLLELLDLARVSPSERNFRLEAALPLSVIQRQLGDCSKR